MKTYHLCTGFLLLSVLNTAFAETNSDDARARMKDSSQYEADNTGRNQRDRDMESILPENQSNKKELIDVTASIRKDVVDDDTLSVTATNVKIMTLDNGTVVLRGPVKSKAEKDRIESIAKRRAAGREVRSYLEISNAQD